jgi:hypothetical protein
MEQSPPSCIVCCSVDCTLLIENKAWSVHECAGRGLGVPDPRPGPEELGRIYEKEYFDSHYSESLNIHVKTLAESDTGLPIDRPKSFLKI